MSINERARYCPKCGKHAASNAKRCPECNTVIDVMPPRSIFMTAVVIICCAVMAFSVTFPYIQSEVLGSRISETMMENGDGVIWLALAAIGSLACTFRKRNLVIITGLIATVMVLFIGAEISSYIKGSELGALVERGAGFYMMLGSSVGLLISGIGQRMVEGSVK